MNLKSLVLVGVMALILGWNLVRTYYRYTPVWAQPEFGKVTEGDIRVPITAAGLIEPADRIEIKPEASGEVLEVKVVEGDFVHRGDVLVLLDPVDEQRNVDRAKAARERAELAVKQAETAVDVARYNVRTSESRVEELQARLISAAFDLKKTTEMSALGQASDQQLVDVTSQHDIVKAQIDAAIATVDIQKNRVTEAETAVEIQKKALEEAIKTYEETVRRLEETTIRSVHDALVTEVMVSEGQIVQGGKQGLTGGTRLMTLADISKMMVLTRVDESDYGKVHAVSPLTSLPKIEALRESAAAEAEEMEARSGSVTLTVDAFPNDKFEGRIERVEPQGKLNAGSSIIQFDVHVEITDEDRYKLPLGAQAQVEFTVESVQNALLVPAEAAMTFEGERGVWLKTPGSNEPGKQFGRRFLQCKFGITDGAHTQVLEVHNRELTPGTEVYTKLPREEED